MAQLELPGISLAAVEAGSGPTLIFVHGSASDHRTWAGQVPVCATHHHVIAYSRRYHWPNEPIAPGAEYAMAEQLDDLLALLDRVDAPADLVGHSYGASLALHAAIRAPERIRRLVLVEPPVIPLLTSFPPRPQEILRLLLTKPRTAWPIIRFAAGGLGPAAAAARRGDDEAAMSRFGSAVLGRSAFEALSAARQEQLRVNFMKEELLSERFMLRLEPEAVSRVAQPTLLVTGASSPALFHRLSEQLAALLPRCSQVEIADASHVVHEDDAAAFNAALAKFLDD